MNRGFEVTSMPPDEAIPDANSALRCNPHSASRRVYHRSGDHVSHRARQAVLGEANNVHAK